MELCPASQYEQHDPCMPRKTNHSTSLFPKRANGPLELAGWREERGFPSELWNYRTYDLETIVLESRIQNSFVALTVQVPIVRKMFTANKNIRPSCQLLLDNEASLVKCSQPIKVIAEFHLFPPCISRLLQFYISGMDALLDPCMYPSLWCSSAVHLELMHSIQNSQHPALILQFQSIINCSICSEISQWSFLGIYSHSSPHLGKALIILNTIQIFFSRCWKTSCA